MAVSLLLLTSCPETPKKTEPLLKFPAFPDLPKEQVVVHEDTLTVEVPQDWIVELAEYRIRIRAVQKSYEEIYE